MRVEPKTARIGRGSPLMQKPELLILRESNGIPFVGKCSMCSNVIFETGDPIGVSIEHHAMLEKMFRQHCREAHPEFTTGTGND